MIDRIMREAFTKEDVMAWIETNLPDEPGLTFGKDDTVLPNKRAETLCFVYRGGPTAREANEHHSGQGPSLIHDVLARVIVATRTSLQKFKHDDAGTQEGKDRLFSLLAGLEGALLLGLSISKIGIKRDQLLDSLEAWRLAYSDRPHRVFRAARGCLSRKLTGCDGCAASTRTRGRPAGRSPAPSPARCADRTG
ncbi:hypothetical protein ABZ565_16565 [Streptomyces sp. NPDC016469]|uniref:hypothetical protein n=1 Tax=Streptomyces sp. NPDC016469 TaxID=3157191 RepID=UPI0033FBA3E7